MRYLYVVKPTFGCDPEFFFTGEAGEVVGSETVLPEGGFKYNDQTFTSLDTRSRQKDGGKIVMDGVQAELHPHPNYCRANLGLEIAECMRDISKFLATKKAGINFGRTVVEVSKETLERLSEEAKKLGCAPSLNAYGLGSAELASINAVEYRKRSAGGHIHMGGECISRSDDPEWDYAQLAQIMDYVCGNTCVLIDRDPETAERRKLYGRAGEYRTPLKTKGAGSKFEYRTLSNFWLRDYKLMSLVMGLCRMGVTFRACKVHDEVLAAVPKERIIEAINTNNAELARENLEKLRPLFVAAFGTSPLSEGVPLATNTDIDSFLHLAKKGLDHYFPADKTLQRWSDLRNGHNHGWESWCTHGLRNDMFAEKATITAPPVQAELQVATPHPAVTQPRDAMGRFAVLGAVNAAQS